jgi:hypothetical protein
VKYVTDPEADYSEILDAANNFVVFINKLNLTEFDLREAKKAIIHHLYLEKTPLELDEALAMLSVLNNYKN